MRQARDRRIQELLRDERFTSWLFGGEERLQAIKSWLLTPAEGSFNIGESRDRVLLLVLSQNLCFMRMVLS